MADSGKENRQENRREGPRGMTQDPAQISEILMPCNDTFWSPPAQSLDTEWWCMASEAELSLESKAVLTGQWDAKKPTMALINIHQGLPVWILNPLHSMSINTQLNSF